MRRVRRAACPHEAGPALHRGCHICAHCLCQHIEKVYQKRKPVVSGGFFWWARASSGEENDCGDERHATNRKRRVKWRVCAHQYSLKPDRSIQQWTAFDRGRGTEYTSFLKSL